MVNKSLRTGNSKTIRDIQGGQQMLHLLHQYEEEKRKLNDLGQRSLEQAIPLHKNEAVQAQSRIVDELVIQFYRTKSGDEQRLRK